MIFPILSENPVHLKCRINASSLKVSGDYDGVQPIKAFIVFLLPESALHHFRNDNRSEAALSADMNSCINPIDTHEHH